VLKAPVDAPLNAQGARLNRRGIETRARVLAVAVELLASSRPGEVSANLVAKKAGVTWGTVQHQFGDVDGLWAAVLGSVDEGGVLGSLGMTGTVPERVREVVEMLWAAYDVPVVRAAETLRASLPATATAAADDYPLTVAQLGDWDRRWREACRGAFDDLGIDPVRLARIENLLPAAVRGLHLERGLTTWIDVDAARTGLIESTAAYLEAS
jgi:AcrR family transcriptional regulator